MTENGQIAPNLHNTFHDLLLLTKDTSDALDRWGLYVIGWQVVGASLVRILAGIAVGRLEDFSARRNLSQYDSLLTVSLAIASVGGIRAADGSSILAVFAAGGAFRLIIPHDNLYRGEEQVQETVQRLFQLPIFVLFGMLLPWNEWFAMGWKNPVLVVAILVLRRIPALLLIKPIIRPIRHWSEAMLCGWLGPIGISALFCAALTQEFVSVPEVWPITEPACRNLHLRARAHRETACTVARSGGEAACTREPACRSSAQSE